MTMTSDKWRIYNDLINLVPSSARIKSVRWGRFWILLETDRGGLGLAQNQGENEDFDSSALAGRPLREVAEGLKSWDFNEAALGLAAVNAVVNNLAPLETGAAFSRDGDAFELFMSGVRDKKVAVIGHFPYLEKLRPQCRSLVILERAPRPGDLPDSAAEYILPEQDQVFITSSAFINKTMPRLLELSQKAKVGLVGPSTPMAPILFQHGLSALSGLAVTDAEVAGRAVTQGGTCIGLFGDGVKKINLTLKKP